MTHSFRLAALSAALVALAGCSRSSEQPQLTDDLKQDLATAGASTGSADVQLAGATGQRVEVVSAVERTNGAVVAPKAPTTTRAPSASHGTSAPARSPRKATPAPAEPAPQAPEAAPVEVRTAEPLPEPVPSQSRPRAPQPSTQREPPGGWKTPGQVIRNAPFPINP